MTINKDETAIFSRTRYAKTEYGVSSDIEVYRHTDGSVRVVVGVWSERADKCIKVYELSESDAAILGKALLCIPEDEDFGAIMSRAAAWSGCR